MQIKEILHHMFTNIYVRKQRRSQGNVRYYSGSRGSIPGCCGGKFQPCPEACSLEILLFTYFKDQSILANYRPQTATCKLILMTDWKC